MLNNTLPLFATPLESPAPWPLPPPPPAPAADRTGPRWFIRCASCLTVAAVTEQPDCYTWRCGICNGPIENMGKVSRDRLTHEHISSPCDSSCTNARGPICICSCGGKNHGTKLVVRIIRDAGPVPIVAMPNPEKAKRIAIEYQDARAAALARLNSLLALKRRGVFLTEADFRRLRTIQHALAKAHTARTHESRMRTLRASLAV